MQPTTQRFKVRLVSTANPKLYVTFDVTPSVGESRSAQYEALGISNMPGDFQVYKGTPSREFSLNDVTFISRTPAEARQNLIKLNILRSWLVPYFGSTSKTDDKTSKPIEPKRTDVDIVTQAAALGDSSGALLNQKGALSNDAQVEGQLKEMRDFYKHFLGAPPDVLHFSAFSDKNEFRGNISNVPVVMKTLSFNYPNDVDYIPVGASKQLTSGVDKLLGTPFPTFMTLSINLTETHSPREYMRFNLLDYREGNLESF